MKKQLMGLCCLAAMTVPFLIGCGGKPEPVEMPKTKVTAPDQEAAAESAEKTAPKAPPMKKLPG